MRFGLTWMSVGACVLSLNGCFKVGDDDSSGGQGGQSDGSGGSNSTGGTGGSSAGTGTGASGGTGGSSAGQADRGGSGGSVVGGAGRGGSGGARETTGGSAGRVATGGSSGKGGSAGKGGKSGSAGSGNLPPKPGTCLGYSTKLESCGVVDGPIDCSTASSDPKLLCSYGCFEAADCGTVSDSACFNAPNSVSDCLQACQGFTCNDGSVIPLAYQCDDLPDCPGGEDEIGCLICDGYPVEADYLCDGVPDCSDASDEANCPTQPKFKCADGASIDGRYRCDGYSDCADSSDEAGCALLTCTTPTAPTAGVACNNAALTLAGCGLLPGNVTTGCSDRTEYRACQKTCFASATCADLGAFFCGSAGNGASVEQCIADCSSLSDEFPCKSGEVVPGSVICNGDSDCSDGTDEVGCTFSCAASGTVPEYDTCNGVEDCADGSDEQGCTPTCGGK
jgi:hypothetical protein